MAKAHGLRCLMRWEIGYFVVGLRVSMAFSLLLVFVLHRCCEFEEVP